MHIINGGLSPYLSMSPIEQAENPQLWYNARFPIYKLYPHPAITDACKVLGGAELSPDEAFALGAVSGADILDLVSLANKVRVKFAPEISACSIINAKSGVCDQNCRFCAQAAAHATGIETYPLLETPAVLAGAREAYEQGIRTFGIVTSGRGYDTPTPEFRRILAILEALAAAFPDMQRCVSLGILSEECVRLLAAHGAQRYNMNLQTAPGRYSELITPKHGAAEKTETVRRLRAHGVAVCCGGILGLGESWADRVALAFACRESGADGIPLNVLLPIPGTPLEHLPVMQPADVAKAFAMFRLVNPAKTLRFAAGRETIMKDFQGLLMLAGMNSIITGGYLTTRGRSVEDDREFTGRLAFFGPPSSPA